VSASDPIGDPFEALGHPNRRAIVELLSEQGRSVQDLADSLPISRPAVSRHLRLLKEAGLVVEEPVGTRRIYRLQDEGIEALQTYLTQVWGETIGRFRMVAENLTPDLVPETRADDRARRPTGSGSRSTEATRKPPRSAAS
jgi:DNA-binding transcriptional ArsR family regulator